jgi:hypothetical protein
VAADFDLTAQLQAMATDPKLSTTHRLRAMRALADLEGHKRKSEPPADLTGLDEDALIALARDGDRGALAELQRRDPDPMADLDRLEAQRVKRLKYGPKAT